MKHIAPELLLEQILAKDPRYDREAYRFVREALDYTQQKSDDSASEGIRHVSGQELLNGIRDYALSSFGPMAFNVFEEWGVRQCEDFGEIVFNMVEGGMLSKTSKDSRDDFKEGYDFAKTFRDPFLPADKKKAVEN